jgi:tetratricopeptide (TPR) repeat protein
MEEEMFITQKMAGDNNMLKLQYGSALLNYEVCLSIKEDNLVFLNRCLAYLKIGEYDLALEDAKKSIDLNPYHAKAWSRLGSCYLAKNNRVEAKKAFTKAYLLNPENEEYKKLVVEDENDENDIELDSIINKVKELTTSNDNKCKMLKKKDFESKIMENKNLLKVIDDEEFQKKIIGYQNNPLAALKDPQVMNLMMEVLKNFN